MKYRMLSLVLVLAAVGCRAVGTHNLPPAEQLMHPGPGVDGPGPGVMIPGEPHPYVTGAVSQMDFASPEGMMVNWDISSPGAFDSEPLVCPGRYNFPQGAIYRLKLTNVPGRPGVELYPTLEVGPTLPRTDAYLAHNAIPVQFTEEDFDQVESGNFVTKVIYLPDAEFQDLAVAGVETLVSTRLEPGVDPIVEADRRGAILAVIRLGNKDLQVPTPTPANMGGAGAMPVGYCPPGGGPGGLPVSLPGYVAGMTTPQWGMPMSGTPIGLPGPPHIPLGGPAGLQKHVITNHTHTHIPNPTKKMAMHVKQRPGMSYPKPVNRVWVSENTRKPLGYLRQPACAKHQRVGCTECQ